MFGSPPTLRGHTPAPVRLFGLAAGLVLGFALAGCRMQPTPLAAPAAAAAPAVPAPSPDRSLAAAAATLPAPAPPPTPVAPGQTAAVPGVASAVLAEDPIGELIQSIESQYAAALLLYHHGQLDEARAGFDATLDHLLATNDSIPDNPRLQHELNFLLDRIQALESDVLPIGGLTTIPVQTTPLDRVPELTFPLDAATRAAIENDTRAALARTSSGNLPLVVNDVVIRYIDFITTKDRDGFIQDYQRSGRYRAMADTIFAQVGVPDDLLYVAQLESDFDPRLVSRSGARGLWQFMAARADDYGLQRTHWVDQRQDPEMATRAAALHLRDLHAEFGDWYLALAAYNTGPGVIQKAVARTGYADFWKLRDLGALPAYVRNYVPVIIATALIAQNPQQYGFTNLQMDSPDAVDVVGLASAVDLHLAADCARATVGDLQHLNPSLLHLRAPAGFQLKLPQGSGASFRAALARVPAADRLSWRLHWVQPGETWAQLARRYQIAAARLAQANRLSLAHPLLPGTPLAIPR